MCPSVLPYHWSHSYPAAALVDPRSQQQATAATNSFLKKTDLTSMMDAWIPACLCNAQQFVVSGFGFVA